MTTREQIKADLFKAMEIKQVGNTLLVVSKNLEGEMEKQVRAAMLAGEPLTLEDGGKQWIQTSLIIDVTKAGSEQYTWNKAGKAKYKRVLITQNAEGEITERQVIGTCWREF